MNLVSLRSMFFKFFANIYDSFFIKKVIHIPPQIFKTKIIRLFVNSPQSTANVFILKIVQTLARKLSKLRYSIKKLGNIMLWD